MAAKKEKCGHIGNIAYESDEEKYILWWLWELFEAGYIYSIERSESFELSDKKTTQYIKTIQLKKGPKHELKEHLLIREHIYTPDYKITFISKNNPFTWNKESGKDFLKPFFNTTFDEMSHPIVYLEIKPSFDRGNMERLFKVSQKWTFDKYNIFINLIKPKELFEKTFTPTAYLTTEHTHKNKKINFKTKSLKEWLNQ